MTAKIKLNAASGGGSVSLEAPTSTTGNANVEFKLPVADGTSGQALTTNASGQLAFTTVSSAIQTTSGTDNFTIADGNLVIGTGGHGIDFSATANASASGATTSSELLDKYEEGTWQPKLNGNNMNHNHADYVRIGNFVHIDFDITNSTGGFATSMTGLPYDAIEYSAFHFAWVTNSSGGTLASSNLQGGLLSGDSLAFIDAGGNTATNLLNGQRVIGHATYRTS